MKNRLKGKSVLNDLSDYVVIDLETTGFNVNDCSIIELAAVRVRNNQIVDTYDTFVNPEERIPRAVTELTGITNDMVSSAPTIEACLPEFLDFIGKDILLGHNIASFDTSILYDNAMELFGRPLQNDYLDTLHYARHCELDVPNYKLETIQDYLNVVNEGQHRAVYDCIATHECYQKLKPLFIGIKQKASGNSAPRNRRQWTRFSEDTQSLNLLKGLLLGVTCDNVLTEAEVMSLKNWVDNNRQLEGHYPFDFVLSEIDKALEDGVLEQAELDHMLQVFSDVLDPVENFSEKTEEASTAISFDGKSVCLTGEFVHFEQRTELENILAGKGAIIKKSVIKALDYLIVGGNGSENWSCGNYGTKVKRALELQEKGSQIKILKEEELMANV